MKALLGAPLAERTKRSVMLTPLGAQLADRARAVRTGVGEMVALANNRARTMRGPLRLGSVSTTGPFLFARRLPRLRQDYPGLKLYLRKELTESPIAGLRAGRLVGLPALRKPWLNATHVRNPCDRRRNGAFRGASAHPGANRRDRFW